MLLSIEAGNYQADTFKWKSFMRKPSSWSFSSENFQPNLKMTPSAWYLQVANTIQIEKFIEILSKLTRPAGLEEVVEIVCRDLHVWVFRLVRRWTSLLTVQLAEFEIESTYGKAGIHLADVTKVGNRSNGVSRWLWSCLLKSTLCSLKSQFFRSFYDELGKFAFDNID